MPFYLTRFSYTPETWTRLVKNPEDRRAADQSLSRPANRITSRQDLEGCLRDHFLEQTTGPHEAESQMHSVNNKRFSVPNHLFCRVSVLGTGVALEK